MEDLSQLDIKRIESLVGNRSYVDSHILFGTVTDGELVINVPEVGSRRVSQKSWFAIGDRGVASDFNLSEHCQGVFVPVSLEFLSSLKSPLEPKMCVWDCMNCPKRSASFFRCGRATGRVMEIAKSLTDSDAKDLPEKFLSVARCCELVSTVLQQPEFKTSSPCKRAVSKTDVESLEKVANYLCENLSEDHSLNDLCKYCYINEFKLKKGFKTHYGTTVFGYLRQKRMEYAKVLLEQGTDSVLEVANEVGYSNASHFARAFREQFGYNPANVLANN